MKEFYKLILASASPRRKELLEQIGLNFEIIPAKGEETLINIQERFWRSCQETQVGLADKIKSASLQSAQIVLELSKQKATEVAGKIQEEPEANKTEGKMQKGIVVLGADTIVVWKEKIFGKPKDEADAINMLQTLSGNTHSVFTGVTLLILEKKNRRVLSFYEETKVVMYPMEMDEIISYVKTKEPMDKAGAYGIQGKGSRYIKQIEGDYYNVVGLPIGKVYQELRQSGIEIT